MGNVSVEGVESISLEIKTIAKELEDRYNSVSETLNKIKEHLNQLEKWNGADASEEQYEYKDSFRELMGIKTRYKNIWNINISNENVVNDALGSSYLSKIEENIELLNCKGEDLDVLSATLAGFISIIESELNVNYDGNIKEFFNSLKGNEGWEEYKKINEEVRLAKQNDELYNAYRSKKGDDDYVDFLLDEIGNRRLSQGIGIDDGTYPTKGSSKYGQWYKDNYPTSGMTNDAAFCAAAISYAMNKSGNGNAIDPYISVLVGASQAQSRAQNGQGVWHPASDTSYTPQRGDIFYQCSGSAHTGVVLDSNGTDIYTIEANTASNNYAYGTVNTRVRELSYVNNGNSLSGYYSPNVNINKSASNISITEKTINEKKQLNSGNN